MNFVPLKTQTEFSITQGINKIQEIVEKASENNMQAMAITDLNGMYGAIAFYKECKSKGIKPIVGIDVTVEQMDGNKYNLTLLAKNENGYKIINELNSKAYLENRTNETAFVKEDWLSMIKDIIVLSGAKKGLIGQYILKDDYEKAKEVAKEMSNYFGEDFYIELQRDGANDEEKYMDGAVQICKDLNLSPVATHPSLFKERDDFLAHEARYCIGAKESLLSIKRPKLFNKEMYFKTQEEMIDLFKDIPAAIENTEQIAKKCNLKLHLDNPQLPNFPTPNNENINDYFAKLAKDGLEERLSENFTIEEKNEKEVIYKERLEKEIEIIQKMGFPGYFLIVSDFIKWAKGNDIPVGPGRGSGAGSLVAYAMKITDLDPLPYNLLFERFLNPDRVSMPDFDIDFCQARRNEVYEYVRHKYGEDSVCQIGTFGTMASKAVVRDVGRTLGYPYGFVDELAKSINIKANNPISLKQFIFGDEEKNIPADEKMLDKYNNEDDVKKLIDIALKLEGITRQVGTHAAGVVIAPTKLTDFTPLYTSGENDSPSTQYDMGDVEKAGLVKFDFLGLRNLTIIKEAVDLINERKNQKNDSTYLDLRKISLNESKVYENVFAKGNTIGIFQFEGKGMTSVLQKANPQKLEDLIAINALYRPGPMEIIPDWLASKNSPPEKREYPDEKLKGVLEETYGFMIYQEQVMQCAQIIAGYSLGGADLLRRAMGKKKPAEMAKQREIFIEGAKNNNVSEEKAIHLFDLIEKFSGYGFNKSHAAAYSYIAYQTAYLKTFYTEEFITANLNSHIETTNTEKIAILIEDARKNNLYILPPNINKSYYKFNIENDKEIRYGLGAIKGVGDKAVQAIVNERNLNGEYKNFYDFLERVGRGSVNKRVLEALVKAGALDDLHENRAELFDAIAKGLDYVDKFRKKQLANKSVLGDMFENIEPVVVSKRKKKEIELIKPEMSVIEEWGVLEKSKNEKSVLGFFFSSNPFNTFYAKNLDGFEARVKLAEIEEYFYDNQSSNVLIGGIVESINWWKSKKGAFVTISDGTSTVELSLFADFLNENKDWFKEDAFAALKVKLSMQYSDKDDKESIKITGSQGFSYEKIKEMLINKIMIGIENSEDQIKKFQDVCKEYVGSVEDDDPEICLYVENQETKKRNVEIKKFRVKGNDNLITKLKNSFGEKWVVVKYKKSMDNINYPEIKQKKQYKKY